MTAGFSALPRRAPVLGLVGVLRLAANQQTAPGSCTILCTILTETGRAPAQTLPLLLTITPSRSFVR
jgi:hypothetical protein